MGRVPRKTTALLCSSEAEEAGRSPVAGAHQVGVGALQRHGSRVTAQNPHHPRGQLLYAGQEDTHGRGSSDSGWRATELKRKRRE